MFNWLRKISKKVKGEPKENVSFWPLHPLTDRCDSSYERMLDVVWNDPLNVNIAISGSYGSGKSTFLRSYFTKHKKVRVLWLSLLDFCERSGFEDFDDDLEESVFQQIMFSSRRLQLPYARTRLPEKYDFWRILVFCGLLLAIASIGLFLLCRPQLARVPGIGEFYAAYRSAVIWGVMILSLGILSAWCRHLHRFFHQCELSVALKLTQAEVKVKRSDSPSVLNQRMDELLYFFACRKYDAVVFEDIDRFDNRRIFTKLREVSVVIHNSPIVKVKPRFVYAVRDDLFKAAEERTKFFDAIVPILPYVSPSNARSVLLELLRKGLEPERLPSSLSNAVNELAGFVPDARVVRNIANEYFLYRAKLKGRERENNCLFGLIVLKNLLPGEYARLLRHEGAFNCLLDVKQARIERKVKDLEKENTLRQSEFEQWNKGKLLQFSGRPVTPADKAARSVYSSEVQQRQAEIKKGEDEIKSTRAMTLVSLVHRGVITEKDMKEALADSDSPDWSSSLFFKLIDGGYLTENYPHYMTIFHEGYLSASDMEFVMNVINFRATRYETGLDDPVKVAEEIPVRHFSHPQTLNFFLLGEMLDRVDDFREKIEAMCRQIQNLDERGHIFVSAYVDHEKRTRRLTKLFHALWKECPGYITAMLEGKTLTQAQKARQLGWYLSMLVHLPRSERLPRSVWSFVNELVDSQLLFVAEDRRTKDVVAAIRRYHFFFNKCSEQNLRKSGLWTAVEEARAHKKTRAEKIEGVERVERVERVEK